MASDLPQQIHANAATLRALHAQIRKSFKTRSESPEHRRAWIDACALFNASYDALAFPGGYEGALKRLLTGDRNTAEAAIVFLELRPYFFRSRYMHKKLARCAKRAPLSKPQAQRLGSVLQRLAEWRELRRPQNSGRPALRPLQVQ